MYTCTFFHDTTELATRRLPSLPPQGTEVCIDGHLDTVYYVEGWRIFLEEWAQDIRTEVYVVPMQCPPDQDPEILDALADQGIQAMLEELAARPWRPSTEA